MREGGKRREGGEGQKEEGKGMGRKTRPQDQLQFLATPLLFNCVSDVFFRGRP